MGKKNNNKNNDIQGKLVPETPEQRKILNATYTNQIAECIGNYHVQAKSLGVYYESADQIIDAIDFLSIEEKRKLSEYKHRIVENTLKTIDIDLHIQSIEDTRMRLEKRQDKTRNALRSIANSLIDKEDKKEHNTKISAFCTLFMAIDAEIHDLVYEFDQLRRAI
ncbi:MAG: hypothetical protein NTY80_04905 [candidate division SR1 bacterium]|nr:hypothetical protein [candidate division SR1 bacterium]